MSKNRIHRVNEDLWYIQCEECQDWFKYKPPVRNTNINPQHFCEYCRKFKKLKKDTRYNERKKYVIPEKEVCIDSIQT